MSNATVFGIIDRVPVHLPLTADQTPAVDEFALQLQVGLPEYPKAQEYVTVAPTVNAWPIGTNAFAGAVGREAWQ